VSTLYIARHGQTPMNVEGRYPGYSNITLTALGEEQARTIGRILRRDLGPRPALAFIASPLLRAQVTMRLLRSELDLPPNGFATDARLLDIDHGDWTGLTVPQVQARFAQNWRDFDADPWNTHMQGGENHAELAARVRSFLNDLNGDTVTVSHGATTQMLRGLTTGLPHEAIPELDEPQGVVFRVRDGMSELLKP
jgi:probable phosphoglycerate mutase